MLVSSKFFLQFVEKIEKLKLSLSKQHNSMLKIRSEMLKTRKKGKTIKLGKFFRECFKSRESREFSRSREFFENFVSRKVENPGKRETVPAALGFTVVPES